MQLRVQEINSIVAGSFGGAERDTSNQACLALPGMGVVSFIVVRESLADSGTRVAARQAAIPRRPPAAERAATGALPPARLPSGLAALLNPRCVATTNLA